MLASKVSHLRLHHIDTDRGPLSKYFGAYSSVIEPHAILVVGDDDMYYGPSFVEDYACAVASAPPDVVFSSGIDHDCGKLGGCVMGFRGIGLHAAALSSPPTLLDVALPTICYLADDVAMTYYLTRIKRLRIRRLRLRTKYKFDDEFAWLNSSINAYHRQRKFRINKACVTSLLDSSDPGRNATHGMTKPAAQISQRSAGTASKVQDLHRRPHEPRTRTIRARVTHD